jgi:hypothetical protein
MVALPMILLGAGNQVLPLRLEPLKRPMPQEKRSMHDFLIALAFVGMVIAPAIVAAKSVAPMDEGE